MSEARSLLVFLSDPRLAPYATGRISGVAVERGRNPHPVGQSAAAAIFNAASPHALTGHTIDPKGSAALQIARLAGTLPHGAAPRLERLRGFGGRFGGALMCGCSRIMLADRTPAHPGGRDAMAGPALSLAEQAQRLLAGCDEALALFAADGALLHATDAARQYIDGRHHARGARRRSARRHRRWPPAAPPAMAGPAICRSSASAPMRRPCCWRRSAAQAAEDAKPAEPQISADGSAADDGGDRRGDSPSTHRLRRCRAPPVASTSERRQPLRFVWQMDDDGRFTSTPTNSSR